MKNKEPATHQEMIKKPHIHWIFGMFHLFSTPPPSDLDDQTIPGFFVGKQILGLYMVEIILKDALDNYGLEYKEKTHNIHKLFNILFDEQRRSVERIYTEKLDNEVTEHMPFARSADSFLQYLGKNPITQTRYFWDSAGRVAFVPHPLACLIVALLCGLYEAVDKEEVARELAAHPTSGKFVMLGR